MLRKFSGDPLDWKSFKETFEVAVHSSDSISNIEKFTYLKTYLDKSALQATEGFPLTNENYAAAWQLLDKRYGNEQLIVSCHMNNLIKLEHVFMIPEVNSNGLKSQTALKCRSVYMAIYMEISLRQLCKQEQDSIAHVQMISFN